VLRKRKRTVIGCLLLVLAAILIWLLLALLFSPLNDPNFS
jgi:hypothetical protein